MDIKKELTKERGTSPDMLVSTWMQWVGLISALFIFAISYLINESNTRNISFLMVFLFIPYKPYQKWLRLKMDALTKTVSGFIKGLFYLIIVVSIGWIVVSGGWKLVTSISDWITPDKWTLMVCSEKLNDYECAENSYVIPGFKSKNDCLLEGASKFDKQGFECGSNCDLRSSGLRVCKEICNKGGCS